MNLRQKIEKLEEKQERKRRKYIVFPRFYKGQYYVDGEPIADLKDYMQGCGAEVAIINNLPRFNEKGELIL